MKSVLMWKWMIINVSKILRKRKNPIFFLTITLINTHMQINDTMFFIVNVLFFFLVNFALGFCNVKYWNSLKQIPFSLEQDQELIQLQYSILKYEIRTVMNSPKLNTCIYYYIFNLNPYLNYNTILLIIQ